MKIPCGYTEDMVLNDIEHVTERLSRHFRFGYYTKEDIKQEGCVFALEGLKKYNPKFKTSLRTFLYTHVRNRFINMKRKCFAQGKPCIECGFCDRKKRSAKSGCREFDEKKFCDTYKDWFITNQRKNNLVNSSCGLININKELEESLGFDIIDQIWRKELLHIIDTNLPFEFREDYCRFMQGARLSRWRKDNLIEAIQDLLKKNNVINEEDENNI